MFFSTQLQLVMQYLFLSFVEHGADVNVTNAAGVTPLHDAVNRGNVDIVSILLAHGASDNIVAKAGWVPLHVLLLFLSFD